MSEQLRKSFVSEHVPLRVICWDDMSTVTCPSDWDINRTLLCRDIHLLCRLKKLYVVS